MKYKARLLVNKTDDTAGEEIIWRGSPDVAIHLSGVIDGATATLYLDFGDGFGTNTSELAMTSLGIYNLGNGKIPEGTNTKTIVSGAGPATDLSCVMVDAQ